MDDLKALFLDFDGLISDTESAVYQVWADFYHQYQQELTVANWLLAVGHVDNFNPRTHLESLLGHQLDWAILDVELEREATERAKMQPLLPGVQALIAEAKANGLSIGIASNSSRSWVEAGLKRFDLTKAVDAVVTSDDVNRPKPHPEIYLTLLKHFGISAGQAIAFEDSEPGVQSAKAAGLTVIAVPNGLTIHQDLSAADRILPTLAGYSPFVAS